jgi:hypothetical protein
MSNIIPDHITTREDAVSWLHRHGYSADMAQTEADAWEAGYVPAEEPEIIVDATIFPEEEMVVEVPAEAATEVEEDEEWDDEEDEEEWDDEEDEEEWDDEDEEEDYSDDEEDEDEDES